MQPKQSTILVVEDEAPLIRAISAKLTREGFSILTASSVDQALEQLEQNPNVECIWLDHYLLSSKSGLDFLQEIRSSEQWRNMPVFVVTNTGGEEKKSTYMRLGATRYYIKSDNRLDAIVKDVQDYIKKQ